MNTILIISTTSDNKRLKNDDDMVDDSKERKRERERERERETNEKKDKDSAYE